MQRRPTATERLRIAVRAHKSPKTVDRIYQGRPAYDTSRDAVAEAAQELGYPLPPPVEAGSQE